MADQADQLRKLVQDAAEHAAGDAPLPLVLACGGQHRVGTSAVTLQLALGCQRRKLNPVVVDASFSPRNYYLPHRGPRRDTLVDVLSGGRTVSEALQSGPHGLHVLGGAELPPALAEIPSQSWGRVIGQLRSLHATADLILVDAGAGIPERVAPLWQMADYVVVLAVAEPVGIMDAYGVLKSASGRIVLPTVGLAMNRVRGADQAEKPVARIAASAERFLNLQVDPLPPIPLFEELAGQATAPRRLFKDASMRNAFDALAERVAQQVLTSREAECIDARRAA